MRAPETTAAEGTDWMTAELTGILDRHGNDRSDLVPILQEAEEELGYLSHETMLAVARRLRIPASSVYGVATFYAQFHLKPRGRHLVLVCRGTACHVRAGREIREGVARELGIAEGETTDDLLFTYETVACLGTCALAPLMVIDAKYYGGMTPERVRAVLDEYVEREN